MKNMVKFDFKGLVNNGSEQVEKICSLLCESDTPIELVKHSLEHFSRVVCNLENEKLKEELQHDENHSES